MWDDNTKGSAPGGGLDLEDFAKMALKFRAEMQSEMPELAAAAAEEEGRGAGTGTGRNGGAGQGMDMMERLLREQVALEGAGAGDDEDDLGGLLQGDIAVDDDDDEMPDWADDVVAADPNPPASSTTAGSTADAAQGSAKRSLLLEVSSAQNARSPATCTLRGLGQAPPLPS